MGSGPHWGQTLNGSAPFVFGGQTVKFLDGVRKGVLEVITEPNNKTICPVRLMAIAGFVQFSFMAGWQFRHTHIFDVQAHALAFAALLGGIGAALGLKKDTPNDGDK